MVKSILQSLMLCAIFFTMSTRATEGQWSNWGAYDTCSETCQSDINTAPTQSRTRTCNGGTFGTTCPGSSVDTQNCNVAVACQGSLTQWSAYGACSATCQSSLQPPTQHRTRSCTKATFGGNCYGAALVQHTDCNVEVSCSIPLTQWTQWSACSESCQSNPNVLPTRSRNRQCVYASFGGNCSGASLSMNETCNAGVACPGILTQWSAYGACSATCQSGLQAPTQQRTRNCTRATFGGNCYGASLVEHTDCKIEVSCSGTLTQWANWSACSENCQSNPNFSPTRSRTRKCVYISTGWSCGDVSLSMNETCNVGIGCPGNLTSWSDYSACSSTCQPVFYTPTQHRTRTCMGATFGGDCNGASLNETIYCNLNVACPGILSPWEQWSACSEICQSNLNVTPTKSRARNCSDETFNGNCGGASLTESKTCNAGVDCQDGDQDNNKTIIIVASASIVSTLIFILIIFLIVKFKAKITCGSKPQNSSKNEANDKYDDVAESPSPSGATPKVYAELTPISENFNDYQEINLYQNDVKANTGV